MSELAGTSISDPSAAFAPSDVADLANWLALNVPITGAAGGADVVVGADDDAEVRWTEASGDFLAVQVRYRRPGY